MARKEPDPPLELDPLKGGLKHNPFAALRGKVAGVDANSAAAASTPAVLSQAPTVPAEETSPRAKGSAATQASATPDIGARPASAAPELGATRARAASDLEAKPTPKRGGATPQGSKATAASAGAKGSKPATAPAQERVTVRLERTGRGGKTVTIAEGPGLAGRELEPLAREIARGMGTGARVEDSSIVVQGDQRERLVDWLGARGFGGAVAGN